MEVRIATFLLVASLTCCGGSGSPPGDSDVRRLSASPRPRAYVPPADGRLGETQVARYVAFLQNRARLGLGEADSKGETPGDRDSEAARSLGMSLEEARWIGQRVFDARLRLEEKDAAKRNLETYRATLASLKKALAASTDPATRATVARQIASLEREAAEIERTLRRPTESILASNEALVQRFRIELDAARGGLPELR